MWVYWLSSVAILCHDISVCVIVHNDCDINDDEDCDDVYYVMYQI